MCVYLGEHELIKSIEEDLGESHALPVSTLGCLLLKCEPTMVDGCLEWYHRCHNDKCLSNRVDYGLTCFIRGTDRGDPDWILFKRALYTNHSFEFGHELSRYPFDGTSTEKIGCAHCTKCHMTFEDDPAECALSKSKIL